MKNRRILVLGLAVLLLLSVLAGCSANAPADADYSNEMTADYAPQATMGASLSKGETIAASDTYENPQQKLIRTVYLNAETEAMDILMANVEQRVAELGGYIEGREVYNGSSYNASRTRYANLTIRIPAERMDGFMETVAEISNITSNRETAEDVTLDYVATQSRITALETEQERLLELLAQAKDMEDLLLIEARLTEVQSELERFTSQLRVYDNLVNYGTIHLDILEVRQYTVVEEEPETVWQRIASGFMKSLKGLGTGITEVFVFLISALPYLAVVVLGIAAVILLIRASRKKKKKKTMPPEQGE